MHLNLSIVTKLMLLVVGAVMLTALAVNEVYVRGSNQILTERAIADLKEDAKFFAYPLGNRIERLKDDLLLVSQLQATQALMRAAINGGIDPATRRPQTEIVDRLVTTFIEMLHTRPYYRRIHFIGLADGGKDILLVERFGNQIEQMPEGKLERHGNES